MLQLIYPVFLGAWRRWFGGGLPKLPDNRLLEHVIGFIGFVSVMLLEHVNIWIALICGAIFQGLFWARGHGAFFDFGHGEVDESRYEEVWYWKYVKEYIPEDMLYTYPCDYLLMTIRYTLPAIPLAILLLNPLMLMAGIVTAGVYALCWTFYDLKLTKVPTEIAEVVTGVIIGLMLL